MRSKSPKSLGGRGDESGNLVKNGRVGGGGRNKLQAYRLSPRNFCGGGQEEAGQQQQTKEKGGEPEGAGEGGEKERDKVSWAKDAGKTRCAHWTRRRKMGVIPGLDGECWDLAKKTGVKKKRGGGQAAISG